jgi:sulfoxide reductase heme-binding subunit YedZ
VNNQYDNTLSVSVLLSHISVQLLFYFVLLIPLYLLCWDFFNNQLGANPVEEITHETGQWALRFLLITLVISPLRRIFGWNSLIHLRRGLGLASFTCVLVHFCIYFILDQWFDVTAIIEDVIDRPYITVGFLGFLLMIPLAATSNNYMQRILQHKWVLLHRLTYVIAILGVLHFWWLVKADLREPIIYAAILTVLFGYRIYAKWKV